MIINVVFDCPFRNDCFRHTAKKLCEERMRVNVTDEGRWVAEQPFCDRKPSRNDLLNYHGLFCFFSTKRKTRRKIKEVSKMSWKETIQEELQDCLKLFPELKEEKIELVVRLSCGLSGAKLRCGNQQGILLLVPPALCHKPRAIRPILLHELSHYIDLENPDRVFFERADKQSKVLWSKLQQEGLLFCEVGSDVKCDLYLWASA